MKKALQSTTINVKNKILDLEIPRIMGIINLTPDSFYDGGKYTIHEKGLERASQLLMDGASILDIGAYSSRPGALPVTEEEELERLIPFIEKLVKLHPEVVISVDTFRATVAEKAIFAGASIINDISGGSLDAKMFETVGELQVPYVLMHMRGTPETMQSMTDYDDLIADIFAYFILKIAELRRYGVKDIILDLGFGFAKTVEQNYKLLNHCESFLSLGLPVLGAVSRKSIIYRVLGNQAQDALNGTTALNTILVMKGVNIIRVHDVLEAKEVALLVTKLKENV